MNYENFKRRNKSIATDGGLYCKSRLERQRIEKHKQKSIDIHRCMLKIVSYSAISIVKQT